VTPPRLEACYFETSSAGRWTRLARVLRATAEEHCPEWGIRVEAIRPSIDPRAEPPRSWQANTQKLGQWARRVEESADGDRILLIDADTFVCRPLDDVWTLDFDLVYTTRRGPFPFNAGVLFLRVSDRIRAFMRAWVEANAAIMADTITPRESWIRRFGGVNQASLAGLLDAPPVDLQIVTLPCREWNCVDGYWHHFKPELTRIVHVKGDLRRACLGMSPATEDVAELAQVWRRIDREAGARPAVRIPA
jgi:hypothetical protein